MPERQERRFPDWAEQERAGDLAWIHENLHVFWPAAQIGYETVGRGAIVVTTTVRVSGGGHPFGYFDQAAIEQGGDEDTKRKRIRSRLGVCHQLAQKPGPDQ